MVFQSQLFRLFDLGIAVKEDNTTGVRLAVAVFYGDRI
jgi:hypothetical protein